MNAFRDIDALLRMVAREKEILKFLFTGRKAPALRQEEALEHFLGGDRRRLGLLLEHGVVRLVEGPLVQLIHRHQKGYDQEGYVDEF